MKHISIRGRKYRQFQLWEGVLRTILGLKSWKRGASETDVEHCSLSVNVDHNSKTLIAKYCLFSIKVDQEFLCNSETSHLGTSNVPPLLTFVPVDVQSITLVKVVTLHWWHLDIRSLKWPGINNRFTLSPGWNSLHLWGILIGLKPQSCRDKSQSIQSDNKIAWPAATGLNEITLMLGHRF